MTTIDRAAYAQMFGPTVGDRLRLADTALIIEVEKDYTNYGDEVKFGGGKVIRDGMGQGQMSSELTADLVITNATIVDYWGIVKADIGIKAGRILAIGKAGNPDIQDHVDIIIGPGTEILAGEGSYRYERYNVYSGAMEYRKNAASNRCYAHELWVFRKGKFQLTDCVRRTITCRSLRA